MNIKNTGTVLTAMKEALKNFDVDKFWADQENRRLANVAFYETDVCKHIISALISSGNTLHAEDGYYNLDSVQQWLGAEVNREILDQFFQAMLDRTFGVEGEADFPIEDNPFEHDVFLKADLLVFSMHGQGSVYWIQPAHANPEVFAKAKGASDAS